MVSFSARRRVLFKVNLMRTPLLTLVGMLLLTNVLQAAPDTSTSAVLPLSRQLDFKSEVNGRAYRIQVAIPFAPAPEKGYAVLYVLDGDAYFGTYSFATRMRGMYGELQPAVVVGIGYPEAESNFKAALDRRQYDFTATRIDPKDAAKSAMLTDPAGFGGADAFLQVIEREVKPRVAAMLPVDSSREILFGHSLGGLLALHALFTSPGSFDTYLVLSPSIWYDHRSVLANEEKFAAAVKSGKAAPRVFVAVGGEEETPPAGPLPLAMTREQIAAAIVEAAMIRNAKDLGARLKALPGSAGYVAEARIFEGESHISVAWATVGPFLSFALKP